MTKHPITRRNTLLLMGSGILQHAVGCNHTTKQLDSGLSLDSGGDWEWAVGGTQGINTSMLVEDIPFAPQENACVLTERYTLGPCYFHPGDYRQDISDGEKGLPMILAFKVVDNNCVPIPNVDVDVWHCNAEGLYSGNSTNSTNAQDFDPEFCTLEDARALESKWFRGVQRSNADGVVYFFSCFPGWYPGRTTHVHVKIVRDNMDVLITQFCFGDAISNDIYLHHPDYTGIAKDTTNSGDFAFAENHDSYTMRTTLNPDGSITATMVITIA